MSDVAALRPPLDPTRLAALEPYWRVEVRGTAESTNALLGDLARAGAEPGAVLVTEHQTSGRGRLDREWSTPPRAALTFSALVEVDAPPAHWPLLPLLVGVVVQSTLSEWLPDVELKWPNDVLVPDAEGWGRKLVGILVERVEGPHGPLAVVGVGINVSQAPEELPGSTATSMRIELEEMLAAEARHRHETEGEPLPEQTETVVVDRTELLTMLLTNLEALTPLLGDPAGLLAAYRMGCGTLGREIDVHLPGGRVHRGTALDLDASGALVVSDGDGTLVVSAGDVVHVRPAG